MKNVTVFARLCHDLRTFGNIPDPDRTLSTHLILCMGRYDAGLWADDYAVQHVKLVNYPTPFVEALAYIALSDRAEQEIYPLIAAIGIGCLFQVRSRNNISFDRTHLGYWHLDAAHCAASCNAYQRYGHQHVNILLYSVCWRS